MRTTHTKEPEMKLTGLQFTEMEANEMRFTEMECTELQITAGLSAVIGSLPFRFPITLLIAFCYYRMYFFL